MWQRFDEAARRTLLIAQEDAGRLQIDKIETEHLLLALLCQEDTVACKILNRQNVIYRGVWEKLPQPAASKGTGAEPILAPKTKRVLEYSADEARRLRHTYISTEHLLLGLLRVKEGRASAILREYGFELNALRAQVPQVLAEQQRQQELAADARDALEGLLKQCSTPFDPLTKSQSTSGLYFLVTSSVTLASHQAGLTSTKTTPLANVAHALTILLTCENHWFRDLLIGQGVDLTVLLEQVQHRSLLPETENFNEGLAFLIAALTISRDIELQGGSAARADEITKNIETLHRRYNQRRDASGEGRAKETE